MEYTELNIVVADGEQAEIITAMLSDYPFDSFTEERGVLKAYIPSQRLADCKCEVDDLLAQMGVSGRYISIEQQNWNALWESNFQPVEIYGGRCVVRAPFHEPAAGAETEVVIMPKMSFGTGHHATTTLMTEIILDNDLNGLSGLDMGSGTGVLAIAAVKRGAVAVDAVDIDEWAYENCQENCTVNGVAENICPMMGDIDLVKDRTYDFVLANINLNILIAQMPHYARMAKQGALLALSGVMESDVPRISEVAQQGGFDVEHTKLMNGWAALQCRRR